MEALSWKVVTLPMAELRPLDKNPFGKITEEKKQRLREKLKRLGNFEVPTVDTDKVLLTFNKRYHLLKEMGVEELEVKVPSRALTDQERKEIIIASNVHEGEWISEILQQEFASIDLASIGVELDSLMQDVAKRNTVGEQEAPEMPIVARFSEKYSAVILVVENEIDLTHLQEILDLGTEKSYKSNDSGQTFVISFSKFIERWKSKS
jgi:hypothetical protein